MTDDLIRSLRMGEHAYEQRAAEALEQARDRIAEVLALHQPRPLTDRCAGCWHYGTAAMDVNVWPCETYRILSADSVPGSPIGGVRVMAQTVDIDTESSEVLVNGRTFPYYLAREPSIVAEVGADQMGVVNLPIVVDPSGKITFHHGAS